MSNKQPDFQELFFQTFSKQPSGISYRVRSDSNFTHDLYFLRSLINGAEFKLKDIKHEKQTLEIAILRARWELRDEVANSTLLEIPSVIKFSRAKRINWVASDTKHRAPFSGDLIDSSYSINSETTCEIDGIFVGESTHFGRESTLELVLHGAPGDWHLRIFLAQEGHLVFIKDKLT
ncbi:hypothetical protein [Leptothrix ochracea]|uniref:hypothetical protein n=1 Tax=Leptothrix ochracea TaxID=735331 RepID=UPI0034E2C385